MIKTCRLCTKEFRATHQKTKYCSVKCRDDAARTGWTMGEYVCEYCGITTTRRAKDAERQRFCSQSCKRKAQAKRVETPELEQRFLDWFSGLAEGEGNFELISSTHGRSIRFALGLRRDDRPVLELIQATLGFGKLYDIEPSQKILGRDAKVNPKTIFYCNSFEESRALRNILNNAVLRTKKARDFAIWSEAVSLWEKGGPAETAAFDRLAGQLRSVRAYTTQ